MNAIGFADLSLMIKKTRGLPILEKLVFNHLSVSPNLDCIGTGAVDRYATASLIECSIDEINKAVLKLSEMNLIAVGKDDYIFISDWFDVHNFLSVPRQNNLKSRLAKVSDPELQEIIAKKAADKPKVANENARAVITNVLSLKTVGLSHLSKLALYHLWLTHYMDCTGSGEPNLMVIASGIGCDVKDLVKSVNELDKKGLIVKSKCFDDLIMIPKWFDAHSFPDKQRIEILKDRVSEIRDPDFKSVILNNISLNNIKI